MNRMRKCNDEAYQLAKDQALVKKLKNKRFRPFCLCLPGVMFGGQVIIPTAHCSDDPLFRQPIAPTAHFSERLTLIFILIGRLY